MKTLQKKYNFLLTDKNPNQPNNLADNLDTQNTLSSDQNSNLNDLKNEYLNLIRCTYPYCKCGKCIHKSTKEKEILKNLPYGNISSTYSNQYNWKPYLSNNQNVISQTEKDYKGILVPNKSRMDSCFKEHLKSGLVSVMKNDYVAMQTEPNAQIIHKDNIGISSKSPFIGRSNYSIMFPGWEITPAACGRLENPTEKKTEIAFTAKSNYQQNFERFEDRYYSNNRASPILKKDNLEANGIMLTETTSNQTYKPYDFYAAKSLNEKSTRKKNDSDNFVGLPSHHYAKDTFLSSYERAFMLNNLKGSYNGLTGNIGSLSSNNLKVSGLDFLRTNNDNNVMENNKAKINTNDNTRIGDFESKVKPENNINNTAKNKNEFDQDVDAIISGNKKVSIKDLEEINKQQNEKHMRNSSNLNRNNNTNNKRVLKN